MVASLSNMCYYKLRIWIIVKLFRKPSMGACRPMYNLAAIANHEISI